MKTNSLQSTPIPLPPTEQAPIATAGKIGASAIGTAPADKNSEKVAKEFESIFLRKMLSGLEKTTSMGGKEPGGEMYGQMITDAFADAMSKAGGIGLAKSIEEHLASSPSSSAKKT